MTHQQRDVADESSEGQQKPGGPAAKVTINLAPRALVSLEEALEITGHSKTERINRALQIYTWLLSRTASGDLFQVSAKDGRTREIQIF